MKRKILAIFLVAVVILGVLAGCGKKKTATNDTAETTVETTLAKDELAGILLLNVGGAVEILYNVDGAVLSVAGFGTNGIELAKEMDTAVGTTCQQTVRTLTEKAVNLGYVDENTKVVVLKQGIDSILPTKDFLDKCVSEVQALVENAKIVKIATDDLATNGYISLEAAEKLLKTYLNLSGDVTFDGPMKAIGSKYYLSTQYLDDIVYYSVDASSGAIAVCPKDDFEMVVEFGFLPEEIETNNTDEETVDPEFLVVVDPTETTK